MLNTEAQQTFVYHCRSSTAWHDASGSDRKALSLLGDNDAEMNTDRLHDFEVVDGCSVSPTHPQHALVFSHFLLDVLMFAQAHSDRPSTTQFTLTVRKLQRLPIRDFQPQDYGDRGQEFGFEVGPVCFS